MGDPHPSSSSLREPLLDPEVVENSNYWVQCRTSRRSENSLGLEDVLRSWYDQRDLDVSEANGGEDGVMHAAADGDDPEGMHRSERTCRPWYRNPLQIMAMISNFSTSFNVVNISLVLPILKVVLKDINPVNAEDEVSALHTYITTYITTEGMGMRVLIMLTKFLFRILISPCWHLL